MEYPPNDDDQPYFATPTNKSNTYYPDQQLDTGYPLHQPNTYPYQPPQAPIPPTPPKKKTNGWHVLIALIILTVALFICGIISAHSYTPVSSLDSLDATATANTTDTPQPTDTPTDTPAPTTQPTEQPTFPPQQWTFTGNGNQKTTGFAPLRDTWQLSWTCDPASYGYDYNLIVELYDINGNLIDTPVNVICKSGVISGSTMEYNASGLYYLDVSSEGPWMIKVQTQ
jgi:hypothetical protein